MTVRSAKLYALEGDPDRHADINGHHQALHVISGQRLQE